MLQLFSFGTPCFQTRSIGYFIAQYGFPSFLPPFWRRYFTSTCNWSRDDSGIAYMSGVPLLYGLDGQGAIISGTITENFAGYFGGSPGTTYSGNTTPNCVITSRYPGYGNPPPQSTADQQWTVTDGSFTLVQRVEMEPPLVGARIITSSVTLSNEYTLGQLEQDGDALLAQALASGAVQLPAWGGLSLDEFGPEPLPDILTGLPDFTPDANETAVAWSGMGYVGIGTQGTFYPNAFLKVIGYVMMAGVYRQRTYTIAFDPTHTSPSNGGVTCQNGFASCGSQIIIQPPHANANTNAFVTVTPNKTCP